jgi:hypothetical protein
LPQLARHGGTDHSGDGEHEGRDGDAPDPEPVDEDP